MLTLIGKGVIELTLIGKEEAEISSTKEGGIEYKKINEITSTDRIHSEETIKSQTITIQ
jgi:hypothetical protein